jgi:hypothetical protein
MFGAMRKDFRRQAREFGGDLPEVAQARRDDDAARGKSLAIVQREVEALGDAFQRRDQLFLEPGYQTFLKREAICGERIERHRAVVMRVGKIVVGAEALERELALRIVKIRREPF